MTEKLSRSSHAAAVGALTGDPLRAYLTAHSGLPGPRANLELMGAAADVLPRAVALNFTEDPDEYLRCCGVVTLGRLLREEPGDADLRRRLTAAAADESWRVREAAAMAGQRIGDGDSAQLVEIVREWTADADPLVVRAAVAAICEPRLLRTEQMAREALDACSRATAHMQRVEAPHRRDPDVRVLRQGLAYCWSVAVAAAPAAGLPVFAALDATDPDIAWVIAQNRRKRRLADLLPA